MTNPTMPAPTIRRGDLLAAEVTKILTHPVTWIAGPATLLLNTGLGILDAADVVRIAAGDGIERLSDLGNVLFAPVYVFIVIAVFAAGSEFSGGQLRATLTAVPARPRLFAAKLVALFAVLLPGAIIAVTPGRLVSLLAGTGAAGFGTVAVDLVRWTAVYLALSVVAFGLAVLLRSVVAPLALLTLVPLLSWTGVFQIPEVIRFLPHDAGLSLLGMPASPVTELDPGTAGSALLGWCLLTTIASGLALTTRDS